MKTLTIKVGKDDSGQSPICPYCEKELDIITDYRSHLRFLSNMHLFACPYCRKVLSIIAASK